MVEIRAQQPLGNYYGNVGPNLAIGMAVANF